MPSQGAEQIIAGVVLSERLAVTMYGAIHRAQWSGQRNMRALVIDPKMLAETSFRAALTDTHGIEAVIALEHPSVVPIAAVESGGSDVVIVTRGVGRYVTVQDLIAAARANRREGGKLALPVAATIGKSVVEALAAAHEAGFVHGAVHPRSVLVDEDGGVRLGDFVVGRALTTAVAQGADSSLWRGLAGYLAPELVVGEDPRPSSDVFAVGAMLFTMLSGEVPPGTLHVTPAVERLVQRALDTDLSRRYKSAADLLENLLEAFEDDRWALAERGEIIKAAGLSTTDTNIDDATEDLLASLGSSAKAVQVTPMRPSTDLRAEAIAARHPSTGKNRLDALLADLDDSREHTAVDEAPFKRDPISELIQMEPRKREAIVQVKPRVPSLDDPDDTPLPAARAPSEADTVLGGVSSSTDESAAMDAILSLGASPVDAKRALVEAKPRLGTPGAFPRVGRPNDEIAAMDALASLDGPERLSSAADAAELAAAKLEQAAKRAEAAAARVETGDELVPVRTSGMVASGAGTVPVVAEAAAAPPKVARAVAGAGTVAAGGAMIASGAGTVVDPILDLEAKPVRIRSTASIVFGVVAMLAIVGGAIGIVYMYKQKETEAEADQKKQDADRIERERLADEMRRLNAESAADRGAISISAEPAPASVWLKLGRTPLDSLPLSSGQMHELRVEGVEGYQDVDTQVLAWHWSGGDGKTARTAKISIPLDKAGRDPKTGKPKNEKLPPSPRKPPGSPGAFPPGRGVIHIESTPAGAEVWLFLGEQNVRFDALVAGRAYELRVLKDGYLPGYINVTVDEWRDPKGDPKMPIDRAPKKAVLEKTIELTKDPDAPKGS